MFTKTYPTAVDANWIKKATLINTKEKPSNDYKVNFLLDNNRNSILYSEAGKVLETKTQILTDQLPPIIMKAIKNKYPGVQIVSASTFKNSTIKGTYSAVIKTHPEAEERELIIKEDGTFVN